MNPVNFAVVATLTEALERARQGEIMGFILIELTQETHAVVTAGSAETRPTFALGAMVLAQRLVERQILQGAELPVRRVDAPKLAVVPGGHGH